MSTSPFHSFQSVYCISSRAFAEGTRLDRLDHLQVKADPDSAGIGQEAPVKSEHHDRGGSDSESSSDDDEDEEVCP